MYVLNLLDEMDQGFYSCLIGWSKYFLDVKISFSHSSATFVLILASILWMTRFSLLFLSLLGGRPCFFVCLRHSVSLGEGRGMLTFMQPDLVNGHPHSSFSWEVKPTRIKCATGADVMCAKSLTGKYHLVMVVFKMNILLFFFQVPVVANALGGILVGLVTSYAGGVRKASLLKLKNTCLQ